MKRYSVYGAKKKQHGLCMVWPDDEAIMSEDPKGKWIKWEDFKVIVQCTCPDKEVMRKLHKRALRTPDQIDKGWHCPVHGKMHI